MAAAAGGTGKKEVHTSIDCSADEARLEDILSRIEGAGSVKVMITYYGGTEQSLAYEVKSDVDEASRLEDKRAVMSGNDPVVVQELYPRVKGVIVVARGAGDISVKRALTEAAAAAAGVRTSCVKVYRSEK